MPYDASDARQVRRRLTLAMIFLIVVAVGWLAFGLYRGLTAPMRASEVKQRLILYNTDHAAIAEACKFVRDNRAIFKGDPNWHNKPPGDLTTPDPKDLKMPQVIKDLQPNYVMALDNGEVRLKMVADSIIMA